MVSSFIHISDFHYIPEKEEAHGVVLSGFFDDLTKQIERIKSNKIYLVLSGDIVQSGSDSQAYEAFKNDLDKRLNDIGIPFQQRICVPGNHDVCTNYIKSRLIEHEGVVNQKYTEEIFNEYVATEDCLLKNKFMPYNSFVTHFAGMAPAGLSISGIGYDLNNDIGVYCLNTALCSSGGVKNPLGQTVSDFQRLSIDTRSIYSWIKISKSKHKILVSHHPLHWLTENSKNELNKILKNHFSLHLSGHEHNQEVFHSYSKNEPLVQCSAPPLFTKKSDHLGYAIISLSPEFGVTDISYRQWTKYNSFVSGVNFANSDDGNVSINKTLSKANDFASNTPPDSVQIKLNQRLDNALISFSTQPKLWVIPVLSKISEKERHTVNNSDSLINITDLVQNPIPTIIRALPQFGLTCLAHYLISQAWKSHNNAWIYLDARLIKPHNTAIMEALNAELSLFNCDLADIRCIVLDSVSIQDSDTTKLLQKICTHPELQNKPIICMQTLDDNTFFQEMPKIPSHNFDALYLLGMPREKIRQVVSDYNDAKPIGEENAVITKVVSDLSALNLHRTPLNCLTLLKVSEAHFDESPVNRADMIKQMLHLLFNVDAIPTYKARPDLKDCEFVLGYLCEKLIRDNSYVFSRDTFLKTLQECCKERFIELEVHVVFDVLHTNNIIVSRGYYFSFKFAYWIQYFAAQRMHHEPNFAEYIFENFRYASTPEIIEFYTGIDRRRDDALKVLIKDIRETCNVVENKCGFPDDMNPYKYAQWVKTEAGMQQMQEYLATGIRESALPTVIKDRYEDQFYNPSKAYDQEIRAVLREYSFHNMMGMMRAGSRALRNSDYVKPEIKKELLQEILRCWEQATRVLLVLIPMLAQKGEATFDGAGFTLAGDFGDTIEKRLIAIMSSIPGNIVTWSQDDLYSQKMGPLLLDQFSSEGDEVKKHELGLLIIKQRPRGWKDAIHRYIADVKKNSFYLLDVYDTLKNQYRYSQVSNQTLKEIEYLIRMAVTKHVSGQKEPGVKLINKWKTQITSEVIPDRQV